jgi:parvulin-like peptidyl-prolyl isomerase
MRSARCAEGSATNITVDPSARRGGRVAGVTPSIKPAALGRAIFAARRGVLIGPIGAGGGHYVFEVSAIHPPFTEPLAAVQGAIEQDLKAKEQQAALSAFITGYRAYWSARTVCESGYIVSVCSNAAPAPGGVQD